MKKIDLDAPPDGLSVCSYGQSGSGKTEFVATWPRPVIASNNIEKGHLTVQTMDRTRWFEKDVRPEVWELESVEDMQGFLSYVEKTHKEKPGTIKTVGIEASFYVEMYLAYLTRKGITGYEYWGNVKTHIESLLIRLHNLSGVNTVWTALDKVEGTDNNRRGSIFIPGQAGDLIPAACSYWLYHRTEMVGLEQKFYVHTRPYGIFPARCRAKLPAMVENPTYRSLAEAAGWLKTQAK